VRALARRAAGAIGDRDEVRCERLQALDRFPQDLLHALVLGREELERHADLAHARHETAGALSDVHQAAPRLAGTAISARASRASHSDTAIFTSEPGSGPSCLCITGSRPAAVIHCVTVSGTKPSRRWAYCSRKNSCSCGAKSTTSRRPPGRSTRAASRIARAPSSRKCST